MLILVGAIDESMELAHNISLAPINWYQTVSVAYQMEKNLIAKLDQTSLISLRYTNNGD